MSSTSPSLLKFQTSTCMVPVWSWTWWADMTSCLLCHPVSFDGKCGANWLLSSRQFNKCKPFISTSFFSFFFCASPTSSPPRFFVYSVLSFRNAWELTVEQKLLIVMMQFVFGPITAALKTAKRLNLPLCFVHLCRTFRQDNKHFKQKLGTMTFLLVPWINLLARNFVLLQRSLFRPELRGRSLSA